MTNDHTKCDSCGGKTKIKTQFISRENYEQAVAIYGNMVSMYDMPIYARYRVCQACGHQKLLPREIHAGAKVQS